MAAAARLNCLPRALRLASYQQNCFSRSLPLQPPASMPLMRLEGRAASRQLFANAVIAFPGKSSSPCSPYVAAFRGGRLRASALARRLSAFVVASNSAKQKKLTNNGEDDFTHDGGDHPDMPWVSYSPSPNLAPGSTAQAQIFVDLFDKQSLDDVSVVQLSARVGE